MGQEGSLLDLLTAYRRLKVVAVACDFRLFTHLAAEPLDASSLAARLGVQAAPLAVLLEVCVAVGLLRVADGLYANQPVADVHLVEGRPRYLGHLIHVFDSEAPQWTGLAELLRTGVPPSEAAGGEVEQRRFTLAMHALGLMGEAEALAAVAPLAGCRDLVDVGCGSGVYSVALCRRFPELRATLLDRPGVLETTRELVGEDEVADRLTLVAADIAAEGFGDSRDAVLLSDVLYQDEATSLAVLSAGFRALKPGGKLIIRGYYSDPEQSHPPWGALFDLARQLWAAGREPITHGRLLGWVDLVGFIDVELFPLTERSTCVLAVRP